MPAGFRPCRAHILGISVALDKKKTWLTEVHFLKCLNLSDDLHEGLLCFIIDGSSYFQKTSKMLSEFRVTMNHLPFKLLYSSSQLFQLALEALQR